MLHPYFRDKKNYYATYIINHKQPFRGDCHRKNMKIEDLCDKDETCKEKKAENTIKFTFDA